MTLEQTLVMGGVGGEFLPPLEAPGGATSHSGGSGAGESHELGAAVRTPAFALAMATAAALAGLWLVFRVGQASGWVLVIAAVPWALLALLRLTGGPRRM